MNPIAGLVEFTHDAGFIPYNITPTDYIVRRVTDNVDRAFGRSCTDERFGLAGLTTTISQSLLKSRPSMLVVLVAILYIERMDHLLIGDPDCSTYDQVFLGPSYWLSK